MYEVWRTGSTEIMSETVARMDAGPEPTWTYLRRVSDMIPVLPVRHTSYIRGCSSFYRNGLAWIRLVVRPRRHFVPVG